MKVTVWLGFSVNFILGSYFFEQVQSGVTKTVTITEQHYLNVLQDKIIPELQQHDNENIIII